MKPRGDEERRPLPAKINAEKTPAAYKAFVAATADGAGAAGSIKAVAEGADGKPVAAKAAATIRAFADQALADAKATARAARERSVGAKAAEKPAKRLEQWKERLRRVLELTARGVDAHDVKGGVFHHRGAVGGISTRTTSICPCHPRSGGGRGLS